MDTMKEVVRRLLVAENLPEVEINSTQFDKFFHENEEIIRAKLLELWDFHQYQSRQRADHNDSHFLNN